MKNKILSLLLISTLLAGSVLAYGMEDVSLAAVPSSSGANRKSRSYWPENGNDRISVLDFTKFPEYSDVDDFSIGSATYANKIILPNAENLKGCTIFQTANYVPEGVTIDFSKCKNLEVMDFRSCNIKNVDMRNCVKLKKLDIYPASKIMLTSLNISGCKALEELNVTGKLKNINVSPNTNLKSLFLYLDDLSKLDVSKNKNLRTLSVQSKKLSKLDLSNNTNLEILGIESAKLKKLDLSKHKKVMTVTFGEYTNKTNVNVGTNKKALKLVANAGAAAITYKTNKKKLDFLKLMGRTNLKSACKEVKATKKGKVTVKKPKKGKKYKLYYKTQETYMVQNGVQEDGLPRYDTKTKWKKTTLYLKY